MNYNFHLFLEKYFHFIDYIKTLPFDKLVRKLFTDVEHNICLLDIPCTLSAPQFIKKIAEFKEDFPKEIDEFKKFMENAYQDIVDKKDAKIIPDLEKMIQIIEKVMKGAFKDASLVDEIISELKKLESEVTWKLLRYYHLFIELIEMPKDVKDKRKK